MAPMAAGQALYSPTSVASPDGNPGDIDDDLPQAAAKPSGPLWNNFRTTEDVGGTDGLGTDGLGTDGLPRRRRHDGIGCPELLVGSKLNKSVKLVPSHWVKIGRNPKATLMLNNPGVSRDHCSIRWDHHMKKVELRIETNAATHVNGEEAQQERTELKHADRIRIVGKGQTFEFVLDMRAANLAIGNPLELAAQDERAKARPVHRRDMLKKQLMKLDKDLREFDTKILEAETEYLEVQTRRSMRENELKEKEDHYKFYLEDTTRSQEELDASRENWLTKLRDEYKANEDSIRPIIEDTASLQDKVEKLQLKKDELARSIHPEQYAVADVAVMELPSPAPSEVSALQDDASGEEDAFAGLAGLEENRETSGAEDEVFKRKGGGDKAAEESDAKRPKTGEGEGAAVTLEGAVLD